MAAATTQHFFAFNAPQHRCGVQNRIGGTCCSSHREYGEVHLTSGSHLIREPDGFGMKVHRQSTIPNTPDQTKRLSTSYQGSPPLRRIEDSSWGPFHETVKWTPLCWKLPSYLLKISLGREHWARWASRRSRCFRQRNTALPWRMQLAF